MAIECTVNGEFLGSETRKNDKTGKIYSTLFLSQYSDRGPVVLNISYPPECQDFKDLDKYQSITVPVRVVYINKNGYSGLSLFYKSKSN